MNILVNASNLKAGGGLQVADSFCKNLKDFKQHKFFVVLSSFLNDTLEQVKDYENVEACCYNVRNNFTTLLLGKDRFLDTMVEKNKIDFVFTVFGPSRWNPKVKHLSGFAMAQLVLGDSPFFKLLSFKERFYWKYVFSFSRGYMFARSTRLFYSENKYISEKVEKLWKGCKCYTVSNYYNQIYDNPQLWKPVNLPKFEGLTLLTVSSPYVHKNLGIAVAVAKILKNKYRDFEFRFVISCDKKDILDRVSYLAEPGFSLSKQENETEVEENFLTIGKVDLKECPSLYKLCDMVFLPTLLESFSVVYPEAMRMEKPVLTSDLPFAHSICEDSALYFSALDPRDIAEKIFKLYSDKTLQKNLIEAGKRQLKKFDDYNERTRKIVEIMEAEA